MNDLSILRSITLTAGGCGSRGLNMRFHQDQGGSAGSSDRFTIVVGAENFTSLRGFHLMWLLVVGFLMGISPIENGNFLLSTP